MTDSYCDIVIPVFNRPDLTRECLESIWLRTHGSFSLILIDNGSDTATQKYIKEFQAGKKNVTIIRNDDNIGWVRAVNQGLLESRSPYVCFMNNDTIVRTDNWIRKLIDVAEMDPDIGLVNPSFDIKCKKKSGRPFIEVDFCRGYCVLIKREVLGRIGLLDESYGLGYYDDDDYSVRAIRAGFQCVRADDVIVEHLRDSTFSDIFHDEKRRILHEANKKLFYSKWGRRLKIAIIIVKPEDKKLISDIAFSLARRQHIVYLWNAATPLALEHINIRESLIMPAFYKMIILFKLFMNRLKKRSKRYDMVFSDDARLVKDLSFAGYDIFFFDAKDGAKIMKMADAVSKV